MGGRLDGPLLDRLLALNALQRGRAVRASGDWPRSVVDPVLHGGDGFCLLGSLRSYSAATAELLGVLQGMAAVRVAEPAPVDGVVHFDFQGSNILVDESGVSGVVDWEGCRAGGAGFDLATLFFYADEGGIAERNACDRLWNALVERTRPPLRGAYFAHLVLRQVDWSIRFHDREAIERWLGRAGEVLHRLSVAAEGGPAG